MPYEQEELGYEFDALEPHIDALTMETHYSKHHAGYCAKFNAALEGTEFTDKTGEELLVGLNDLPDNLKGAVRNNGGGAVNHTFFWKCMTPDFKEIGGEIKKALEEKFGSFDKFKEEFTNAALTQFGSGWAWLVKGENGLEIIKTANQDSPLTMGKKPLLCLDVWEHAYYLKYKNLRPDYVNAFFKVINWEFVDKNYLE